MSKIYDWGDLPNPGSKKAQEFGCTCAIIDNHFGKGIPSADGKPNFWISGNCPLHDPKATDSPKPHKGSGENKASQKASPISPSIEEQV